MSTILQVEQGGTGVQTVAELKTQLDLKEASHADISNNYEDTSQSTVPSSYALSEALQAIASAGVGEVVPIEKGGTGATTAEEAIRNLGIQNQVVQFPIQIANGGTGATDVTTALNNLGISLPLPIESGGTGGISVDEVIKNLFGGFPIPLEKGGTGGETTQSALTGLGLGNPIKIEYGGTGASDINTAKKNLEFNKFFVNIIENNTDLNNLVSSGIYVTQGDYVDNIINAPTKDAAGRPHQATLLVMSNYDYNTSGDALTQKIITQILFYLDSTNINLRNRMFIRCRRTKSGEQQPWSPWEEVVKGQSDAKGPMTFYVNTTSGSDTLDDGRGLTAEKPFKTIQAAVNFVCQNYNFGPYTMTIQMATGSFVGEDRIDIPNFRTTGGYLKFAGAGVDQTKVYGSFITLHTSARVVFDSSFTICFNNKITPGWDNTWLGICVYSVGMVEVRCKIDTGSNSSSIARFGVHVAEFGGGILVCEGFNIVGTTKYFLSTYAGTIIIVADITINGTIEQYGATFISTRGGKILIHLTGVGGRFPVISGSVVGRRFYVNMNGIIDTSQRGPNYFPGTEAGYVDTATGGIYV